MPGTRDIDPAVNTALQQRSGTAYAHCVEIEFGQSIRQKPGAATGIGDTIVEWTGRGDLANKLEVYTSVDDGLTWQRIAKSGDPIPSSRRRREDGVVEIAPLRAGTAVTNRTVLARQLFNLGAGDPLLGAPVLDSFRMRVTYEDATYSEILETGADLATGTLIGTAVAQPQQALVAVPETFIDLRGNRGGLTYANSAPHDGDGAKQGLHLSHSSQTRPVFGSAQGVWSAEFQFDHPLRRADAAMAIEGWFLTRKTTGVLCGWTTFAPGQETWATVLELVQSDSSSAYVRFRTVRGFPPIADTVLGKYVESPEQSVRLNRWHHVAFSYDGLWATLTLDGVVVSRAAFQDGLNGIYRDGILVQPFGVIINTDGRFVMGRHPQASFNQQATARSFDGRLSEWRLYRSHLTVGAIQQRMYRRLSTDDVTVMVAADGLAAYYPMTQGSTRVVGDVTGNGLHLLWDQQQVGPPTQAPLPPQLGWASDPITVWSGFPFGQREVAPGIVETERRIPGRQAPPFEIDQPGETLRLTDAPFAITFPPGAPFNGRVFTGVGAAGTIETVQETADLLPTGLRMALSGIPAQHVSIALHALYLDRPCRSWQVTWNTAGEQLEPYQIFEGRMDRMDVEVGPLVPEVGMPAVVHASAESPLRNWRRPKLRRWNDEGQRRLWADDHGFAFLAEMVDKEVWWPEQVRAGTESD